MLPLVVKLNSSALVVAITVITATTRSSNAGGRAAAAALRRVGGSVSGGDRRANSRPQAIDTSAGATKAARQPAYLTISPVTSAASAMPRLPARPLMPIVRPGRALSRSSIGMPTGW